VDQIVKQLNKLVNVINVHDFAKAKLWTGNWRW